MSYTPQIEFDTENGATSVVATALYGVFYWYTHQIPEPDVPDDLEPLTLHVCDGPALPGPGNPMLQSLALGACERKWNRVPDLDEGGGDWNEETALGFLKWLRRNGDITRLVIRGKEYNPEGII